MRVFLFCLLALLLAACRQSVGGTPIAPTDPSAASASLTLTLETGLPPAGVGQSELIVRVTDASGAAVSGATVALTGDMTHAGMMPVQGQGVEIADGRYRIPIDWNMAGDWTISITAATVGGASGSLQQDARVPGS